MEVYVALNSSPDYSAPAPSFKSVHDTLEGAIHALYPDRADFQMVFRKWPSGLGEVWEGPDGFGMVKKVTVQTLSNETAELLAARKRLQPYLDGYPEPMIDARRLRIANGTASEQDKREIRYEDQVLREIRNG